MPRSNIATDVQLVPFDAQFAKAFASLNYEWIKQYFEVEPEDTRALENPHEYAIQPGGEIFFVLEDGAPVGTVAMVPFKGECSQKEHRGSPQGTLFELAKMAVQPNCQGRGYSKLLMQACIEFAQTSGASEIVLITNDRLKPALGLYEAYGFKAMPVNGDTRYARGNLEMRLQLAATA